MKSEMSYTNELFSILNKEDINYCVVDINESARMIELFVNIEDNVSFNRLLKSYSYKKIGTSANEYDFIYGLEPDAFWVSNDGLYVHSACQMSCTSMSNISKCKLPLDRKIQKSIWNNKIWDKNKKIWKICEEDYFIYLLTDCIFNKKEFEEDAITRIKNFTIDFSKESFVDKLRSVFFLFTPKLISIVKESRFHEILNEYRSFSKY